MNTCGDSYEWDRKSTLELIELYKNYEMLWNPKHQCYKNKPVRQSALRDIARELNIDKSEIERQFKNISSHYLREFKKERDSELIGDNPSYKSKWFAFKAMEFLNSRSHFRKKILDTNELIVIDTEEASQNSEESNTEYSRSQEYEPNRKIIKIEDPSEPMQDFEHRCKNYNTEYPLAEFETKPIETATTSKDDSSTFGEYIATKIRPMDKRTKAIVEYEINSIIFKAEMGYYGDKKYVEPSEESIT